MTSPRASGCGCRASWAAAAAHRRRRRQQEYAPARPAALEGRATSRPSPTTTTCPTASTSGCSGRPWPTPAPCTRRATPRWRRPSSPSTTWSRASWGCEPGMRLLDVGCGWGGMVMHAARRVRRARRSGVTLSRHRPSGRRRRSPRPGLSELAEVRHLDYRDVAGDRLRRDQLDRAHRAHRPGQAPALLPFLYDRLRPGGRLLNHCITEPSTPTKRAQGWFISRYVFPDGELDGGRASSCREMHDAGFEVRHEENLREHYALTLRAWVAQPRRALGRGGRRGRPGDRPGVAALHGRAQARLRAQQHPAAPGARACR